ncbi:MAG: cytochrome c [Gammaproteobacteria bacterium]|nr:cytochrome c [Gammaproteobacteria bacterium]
MNTKFKTLLKTLIVVPFFTLISQANAQAANPAHGKDLHDANCMSCHTSLMGGNPNQIYTRSDRKVNTLEGLRSQVTRCNSTVGVAWEQDNIQDVVEYLNSNFYKIK